MKLQDVDGYTPITAKAIENVKCTRIISGEGSDKYNKYIQSLAKKVLTASISRTDGYKHDEVGILARLDGIYSSKLMLGYWNDKMKTSIINTAYNLEYNHMLDDNDSQSLVFVHNHPNNYRLSIGDILAALMNDAIAVVVAVGNNGYMHYISKEDKHYNYIKLGKAISNNVRDNIITSEKAYNILVENQSKYKITLR